MSRRAIVTGAATGLGAGIVDRLARDGWRVALVDVSPDVASTARELAARLGLDPDLLPVFVADVALEDEIEAAVDETVARFGGLDLAVANAGIGGPGDELVDLAPAAFDRVIAVNLRGVYLTCRAAGRVMRAAGSGSIVTVTSIFGQQPVAGGAAYCASKAGVEALTRSLALELAPAGVRCNAIAPGHMATEMHWDELRSRAARHGTTFEAEVEVARAAVPLGRHGTPSDVGDVVAFLASEDAGYVTGQTIGVNGGILFG
jgi:NAD(P)-dependent dehydrogenase (short-subunit alcohol dehydrogenase family)